MTDEPTRDTSDQPTQGADQPTSPPPAVPPTEPSGVGFAALRPPGEQPPGPPSYPPPPPPPPPGTVYQYDYARMPQNRRDSMLAWLFLGIVAVVVVLLVGVGGMVVLGFGPFARPTPTLIAQASPTAAHPTPTPRPTGTSVPSTAPSPTGSAAPSPTGSAAASPTGSPGRTATPIPSGDVTDALLSHIPPPIRPTCTVTAGSGAIVAIATCSADDGNIALTYSQYDSYDSMFNTYEGFRQASQIEPDSGDCQDHDSWPTENGFNISGQLAGRWLCTEALGATSIYWTDNRLNILGQANQTQPDYPRLVEFWVHESGPDL